MMSSISGSATFTAPEGIYRQSHVILPLNELALTSNNVPSTISATNGTLGISTSTSAAAASAASASASPSALASTSAKGSSATNITSQSLSSSEARTLPALTPSHNQFGPTILPSAWRKGAGPFVEPSISAFSVRWNGVNAEPQATADLGLDSSQWSNGTAAAQTESSAGSTSSHRALSRRDGDEARPNPLIEATLVSQGIDSPVASTTGGVGGILGMSALTSYGFLPSVNQLDLERQLSLLSSTSSNASSIPTPSSIYKPSKGVSKPKNGIRQTNSSFVVRSQFHSDLKDILAQKEKQGQGPPMIVTQKGRTLLWLADAHGSKDPLARILLASPPSAHDVNQLTRSSTTLDVIVGFPTGDILWIDLMSLRYSRINKGGAVTPSGITQIRWLPSATHEGLFMTSHIDGTMMIWDREREDGEVNKTWSPRPWRLALTEEQKVKLRGARSESAGVETPSQTTSNTSWPSRWLSGLASPTFGAHPAVVDWDPKRSIILTRPGATDHNVDAPSSSQFFPSGAGTQTFSSMVSPPLAETPGSVNSNPYDASAGSSSGLGTSASGLSRHVGSQRRRERSSTLGGTSNASGGGAGAGATDMQANEGSTSSAEDASARWDKNPIAHWRVSTTKINDFAISPDLGSVSVVADDGLLRIVDLATQSLATSHASYFGSFLSSAWSTDGRLLLATSCDDLVSVYLPRDGAGFSAGMGRSRLLARCVGHDSSVKNAAWDPYRWKDSDRSYRFGSVGEDGKVCLWDFSSKSLGRPKGALGTQHSEVSARPSMQANRSSIGLLDRFRPEDTAADDGVDAFSDVFHPSPPRKEISQLQPVAVYHTYVPPAQTTGATGGSGAASQQTPVPGVPPGLGTQPSTSPLLSIRFSPNAILLHHATGVLQSFTRPSRGGSNVSRLVDDGHGGNAVAMKAGGDPSKASSSTSMMGGLLRRNPTIDNANNNKGLSLGGTLSRGMKWVGGGGGGGSGGGANTTGAAAQEETPHRQVGHVQS